MTPVNMVGVGITFIGTSILSILLLPHPLTHSRHSSQVSVSSRITSIKGQYTPPSRSMRTGTPLLLIRTVLMPRREWH